MLKIVHLVEKGVTAGHRTTLTPHQRLIPDPYHFSLLIAVNSEVNCYGYCVCVCAIPTPTTLLYDSTVFDGPVSARNFVIPFISTILQTNSF